MTFNRRERLLLIGAAAVLGLWALDAYVLTPFLDDRSALLDKRDQLQGRLIEATTTIKLGRVLDKKWRQMQDDGMQADPAEAESKLLRALRDWSREAGVRLSSLRPERSTEETTLPVISVDMSASGTMYAASRLLWEIETARLPVRLAMLQLGSRKDGQDDLSIHLKVTTVYAPEAPPAGQEAPRRRGTRGGAR